MNGRFLKTQIFHFLILSFVFVATNFALSEASKTGAAAQAPTSACNGGTCRIFITSTDVNSNVGGLTGADAVCQARATSVSLTGTYKAWLSDSTDSPSTRFTRSTHPYVRVDGMVVATNWTELTSGSIQNVLLDEKGSATDALAWTNTTIDGSPGGPGGSNKNCSNWTSNKAGPFANNGNPGGLKDKRWTHNSATACEDLARLICVQQ
jgi:hypothetical protein